VSAAATTWRVGAVSGGLGHDLMLRSLASRARLATCRALRRARSSFGVGRRRATCYRWITMWYLGSVPHQPDVVADDPADATD